MDSAAGDAVLQQGAPRRTNAPLPIKFLAFLLPLHVLATAMLAIPDNWGLGVFLWAVLVITFATRPASRRRADQEGIPWYDWVAIACVTGVVGYYIYDYADLNFYIGAYETWQYVLMGIAMVLSLEATRRAMGVIVPIIAILLVGWALWQGYPSSMILTRFYVGGSGMFGTLTDVFLRFVFLFFVFGALMERAGAASFLRRLLAALTGRVTAGSAKAAIFGSSVFGMLMGSSAGNVAVTGSLTIPMMKSEGYRPEKAAAIEAVSGLGGELSPPVMGSAAFVLMAYTATPYREVALISVLPALLYYWPLYLIVHLEASREGRRGSGSASGETVRRLLLDYVHLAVAPLALIVLIGVGFSPTYAAAGGVLTAAILSQIQKTERLTIPDLANALIDGSINFVSLGAAAPVLAIILVIVLLVGLPSIVTALALSWAGGHLVLIMLGVFGLALVLGMGMPIVAAYMILATVVAPALTSFAIPVLTAHLFILWYTQTAGITPPVALATQVASAIAQTTMGKTAYEAIRLSIGMFVVPIIMIFGSLLSPNWGLRLWSFTEAVVGFALWAAALVGWWRGRLNRWTRVALLILIAGIASPWLPLKLGCVAVAVIFFIWQYLHPMRQQIELA